MPDFHNRYIEIEYQEKPGDPIQLGCCGAACARIELSAETKARIEAKQQEKEKAAMQIVTMNGYRVTGLGLAQRAEQLQLAAVARGGSLEYREAHRIAFAEFQAAGANPDRPLGELGTIFAEATPAVKTTMSESDLPRSKCGRYIITGSGTAQRCEGLQLAAARDGKKLSFSDATDVVRAFELRTGAHPDAPLTPSELQQQIRAMRAE